MEYSRPAEVILDTTLADLYAQDSQDSNVEKILVPCYWCSDLDYTEAISKTAKYLYQGTPPPNSKSDIRDLIVQCQTLEPQRFMFAAGHMETVLFDLEDRNRIRRLDAIKTLSVLPKKQRPTLTSLIGIEDLNSRNPDSRLALIVPHEGIDRKRQLIDPDLLYELLSKRCLALSGLPTPQSSILDPDDFPGSVDSQLAHAAKWIRSFPLPRVFKTQQGMSSVGTFIIKTEVERANLIKLLSTSILRTTLQSVFPSNKHLRPSSLIAQEMIAQSSDCFATSFFVYSNGAARFLGACRQEMSESNAWLGANICYQEQDSLRSILTPIVLKISTFLHRMGYRGPAGADIMLDCRDFSRQWIIDLNVRMTGSLTLCFLRGHFSERRGLHEACITQRFRFRCGRDEFRKFFSREIEQGRVVIVAWFLDRGTGLSWGNLVLGAEDGRGLEGLMGRVRGFAV